MSDYDDRFIKVENKPLQLPGRDVRIKTAVIGGPRVGRDTRMMLSVEELEKLLDVAKNSSVQRVLIKQVGLSIDVYAAKSGHKYEVWRLVGATMEPERPAIFDEVLKGGHSAG